MQERSLEIFLGNRDNNFNLLRFIAATAVIYSHCFSVIGENQPLTSFGFNVGNIAVDIFFIISGFLVTSSMISRKSVRAFIGLRFLRIFPGLFINVCFCTFIIGPIFTKLPELDYFTNNQNIYIFL